MSPSTTITSTSLRISLRLSHMNPKRPSCKLLGMQYTPSSIKPSPFSSSCLVSSGYVRNSYQPGGVGNGDKMLADKQVREGIRIAYRPVGDSQHGEWDPRDVAQGVVMKIRGGDKAGGNGGKGKEYDVYNEYTGRRTTITDARILSPIEADGQQGGGYAERW